MIQNPSVGNHKLSEKEGRLLMQKVTKVVTNVFVALTFAFVVVGCSDAEETMQEEEQPMPVEVDVVGYGALQSSNQFSGTIIPFEEVDVTPKASGDIVEIFVKKGDVVEAGDVLAQLDDTVERNAVEQERKRLEQAQNGLERALVGRSRAEKNVAQAQASLKQAEASLRDAEQNQKDALESIEYSLQTAKIAWDEAKKNLERMKALHEEGLISDAEYENAVHAEERARIAYQEVELNKKQTGARSIASAEAAVEQARVGVQIAENSVREAELAVRDAETAVEQARLAVEAAEERLDDKQIVAPVSGEVVSVDFHVGELASPQVAFAKIIDIERVKLRVNVTVDKLNYFEVGQIVDVDVPLLEEQVQGEVSYISSTSEASGLFAIEVEIDNGDRKLRPGMFASIVVEETLSDEGTIVPTRAVVEKQGEAYVFIVENGVAVQKNVEVIRYDTEHTVVKGDVKEGDKIVIKGQNLLSDGNPVEIMEGD